MSAFQLMVSGAIVVGALLASLFFLRFWRQSRDRFFLYFGLAFLLQGAGRIAPAFGMTAPHEELLYLSRLLAYLLIVLAIWTKNRAGARAPRMQGPPRD